MIDWKNLGTLPRKRRDGEDRERLAAISHSRKAAKHKGRNHWRNWERRKMLADKKREGLARAAGKKSAFRRYHDEVRAYWSGARSDHPAKPC